MTYRIGFMNQKGGVGKSSISIQTAHILAGKGYRVLFVDFDPQGNSSSRFYDGEYTGTPTSELFEALDSAPQPIEILPNLWGILVPLDDDDGRQGKDMLAIQKRDESCLLNPDKNLEMIEDQFDFMIFDTPPNLGNLLLGAIIAATHVMIPVQPAGFAADGVAQLYDTIQNIQDVANEELEVLGFVLNNVNASSTLHRTTVEEIRTKVGDLVFDAQVGQRSRIDAANHSKVAVSSFKDGAGRRTQKELVAVVDELLSRLEV